MTQQNDWQDLSHGEKDAWKQLNQSIREEIGPNCYKIIAREELPPGISAGLLDKCGDKVVVMTSDVSADVTVMAINLRRWDGKDSAVDEQPCAIAFLSEESFTDAVMVQHGDWAGRTRPVVDSDRARAHQQEVALSDVMFLQNMPPDSHGPLSDLQGCSDRSASIAVWDYIYRRYRCDD